MEAESDKDAAAYERDCFRRGAIAFALAKQATAMATEELRVRDGRTLLPCADRSRTRSS